MKRLQWSRRVPGRSALRILWWDFSRFVSASTLRLLYGLRVRGLEHVPTHGPVLFVSNHQSFFDPVINGAVVKDRDDLEFASRSIQDVIS